jgi:nucleoid-associated protein
MPIRQIIIHKIEKKPDGTPAILHLADRTFADAQVADDLMHDLNINYNDKAGKAWGLFHAESGAYPFSGWLSNYIAGGSAHGDGVAFRDFTQMAAEHLTKLMEESNLTVGGHALFCHYQQGMTQYLTIALLQEVEAWTINEHLLTTTVRRLDLNHFRLAARINLTEWKENPSSKQYISFFKGKQGRKAHEYFRDFIGCQEGVDSSGETRTLLKAFSDFVESEDLPEDSAREKTHTLVSYSMAQAKLGEPITIDELSELINEDRPKAFVDFIRDKDYGLSPTIPADKKTLNKFRRFTGRAEGLSISFEQHLLGSKIEFNQADGTLTLRGLPTQLNEQLKRAAT